MNGLDRTPRRAEGSSKDAGEHLARSGKTGELKRMILRSLRPLGPLGLTAKEIELETGLSHGPVSSALSTLHEDCEIARLTEKRSHHEVYVLPEDVHLRETREHASVTRKRKNDAIVEAIDDVTNHYGVTGSTPALLRLIALVDPRER